ncbi:MAG TPA: hypothetical protein VKR79_09840 [Gaiellaceae bacterium]|nr:hypothetical protein [Gaiellaceae bacterium]
MTVARSLAFAAVILLCIGAAGDYRWPRTPVRLRPPYFSWVPLGSVWYFVWSTLLLVVATVIVFGERRIALGFVFVGLTAASGGLWLYRYRGGR